MDVTIRFRCCDQLEMFAIDGRLFLPSTMKRKRSTYNRFKPILHEVAEGSKPDNIESHVEVYVSSAGRIAGQTTYRKGPPALLLPRSDTEEHSPTPAAPAALSPDLDAAFNDTRKSSDGKRPTKVCDAQVHFLHENY